MSQERRPGRGSQEQDEWLLAAHAFRTIALEHPGIVSLDEGAPFQTLGRGRTVLGVSLKPDAANCAAVTLCLTLDQSVVLASGIESILAPFRKRLFSEWDGLQTGLRLDLVLEIADLANPDDDTNSVRA